MGKAWSLAVAPCPTAKPPGLSSRGAGLTSPGRGLDAMVGGLLRQLLPGGIAFSECPLSTAGGVKAIDVAWLAPERSEDINRLSLFERAPEICVEIVSPSHSRSEITEKRALYFDTAAAEVWVCNLDGSISFFVTPHNHVPTSSICPAFPSRIP